MARRSNGYHSLAAAFLFMCSVSLVHAQSVEELDSLAVVKDFQALPRTLVLVDDVPQPPQPSGKLQIASNLGTIMTEQLVAEIQAAIGGKVLRLSNASAQDGLVVACRFSKLEPGSRGKRFWVGFGAGKSVLEVSGEVRETSSGRLVAEFMHARSSWCCGFGNNDKEIRDNLVEVARDIAAMVAGRFAVDQKYETLADRAIVVPAKHVAGVASTGALLVDSNSAHSDVEIDGKYVGTTPVELQVTAGEHAIVVRKRGLQDWSRKVEVLADGKQNVFAELVEIERRQ